MSGLPNDQFCWPEHGMTLRDYFAAAALAPIMQRNTTNFIKSTANELGVSVSEAFASAAYDLADAMLAERAKA
ncbi:hypothetical protein C1280_08495 [Gemmata obscuriglobus]|uniref:Uncharacterized protein n=2 Tax=Gemmata obscuriglobus TaxID=114 RepID=A0A2Z3H0D6_9BACT|nr:hypothetical protein C1280_08495 [Gemmata obscuriglobus]